MTDASRTEKPSLARRIFVRGPWENTATALIGLGILMLMQPVSKFLYTYSFAVILIGTIGFVIVSHFPERRGGDG